MYRNPIGGELRGIHRWKRGASENNDAVKKEEKEGEDGFFLRGLVSEETTPFPFTVTFKRNVKIIGKDRIDRNIGQN